jgi:curved DNA-binding protein
MSSSPAGKFQDHYAILGIEPGSDAAAVQAAYTRLSEKFRPDNPQTGDPEKFEAVNNAFEVLSDPDLRTAFDRLKGVAEPKPQFSGRAFFDALKHGGDLRAAILCILYDRRRTQPVKPGLSIRNLEGMLTTTTDDLNFALWYLKQRVLVANDDKSSLQITVQGMDHLESNPPVADNVLPFIKTEALSEKSEESAYNKGESVLSALNRSRAVRSATRATAIVPR